MIELLYLITLLRPITFSPELSIIAEERAKTVYSNWSHNNWKDSFKGTNCSYQGENLAKDFSDDSEIVKAWFNSGSHRENMLNLNYNTIGIGRYENVVVTLYCNELH